MRKSENVLRGVAVGALTGAGLASAAGALIGVSLVALGGLGHHAGRGEEEEWALILGATLAGTLAGACFGALVGGLVSVKWTLSAAALGVVVCECVWMPAAALYASLFVAGSGMGMRPGRFLLLFALGALVAAGAGAFAGWVAGLIYTLVARAGGKLRSATRAEAGVK